MPSNVDIAIENVPLLATQASLPKLYNMLVKNEDTLFEREASFIHFVSIIYNVSCQVIPRSPSIMSFGTLLRQLDNAINSKLQIISHKEQHTAKENDKLSSVITASHLILFIKQLYPFSILIGKGISSHIASVSNESDFLQATHYFTSALIHPNASTTKKVLPGIEWLNTLYSENSSMLTPMNNEYILNFVQIVAGAAYLTMPSITLRISDLCIGFLLDDLHSLNESNTISPVVIGLQAAFSYSNCSIETLILDLTIEGKYMDLDFRDRLVQILAHNFQYIFRFLSEKELTLHKLVINASQTDSTKIIALQSYFTRLILDQLAYYPKIHIKELYISSMIVSDDNYHALSPITASITSALKNTKKVSIRYAKHENRPSYASVPKSLRSTAKKKKVVFHSRSRRANSFSLMVDRQDLLFYNNKLCDLFLNRWLPNSRSICQCTVEKLDLFDITASKFCSIMTYCTTLTKLKIYFDNRWKNVDMEMFKDIRKAMVANQSITHVTIDTKYGNFQTSTFYSSSYHQSNEDVKKDSSTPRNAINVDDCVGFSLFKCVAGLPLLKRVTIEIDFSNIIGLFNPQILSSMFETLQLRGQKLHNFKIRESIQFQNICNLKFTDHLLTVIMSYMDDLIEHYLVFKVFSSSLFQRICHIFSIKREQKDEWHYKLIHLGVRLHNNHDFTFKFVFRFAQRKKLSGSRQGANKLKKEKDTPQYPLLQLIYSYKGISLPDLLVDEDMEQLLTNVGTLARCELNIQLIKKHLSILSISSSVRFNSLTLKQFSKEEQSE
jgi:hypothetical protein